jgi:hypothetical protein
VYWHTQGHARRAVLNRVLLRRLLHVGRAAHYRIEELQHEGRGCRSGTRHAGLDVDWVAAGGGTRPSQVGEAVDHAGHAGALLACWLLAG